MAWARYAKLFTVQGVIEEGLEVVLMQGEGPPAPVRGIEATGLRFVQTSILTLLVRSVNQCSFIKSPCEGSSSTNGGGNDAITAGNIRFPKST